jgi:cyclohexa-1,5-dienecarbonyl-CoA hydratase
MGTQPSVEVSAAPGVTRITLDRPPLNILTAAMMGEIENAIRAAAAEPTTRAIVLAARGRAFCAGVDIGEHTAEKVAGMMAAFHSLCRCIADADVPTVAAVAGPALGGGCEVVALCDIVIAGESATFAQPEIKVGVFPPAAAAAFPSMLGKKGLAPILLGETLSAARALDIGLVTEVVPDGEVEAAVQRVVDALVALSAPVLRLAKRAAMAAFRGRFAEALASAEEIYLNDLMATEDAHEGLEAFLAKRPAAWRHR